VVALGYEMAGRSTVAGPLRGGRGEKGGFEHVVQMRFAGYQWDGLGLVVI
jgi:hypothetical protein